MAKTKEVYMDTLDLKEGLKKLNEKAIAAIDTKIQNVSAPQLENYAKQHREWTDRTGNARNRLTARASRTLTGFRITLSHGVNYGIWLEMANEGKYGIIKKSIQKVGPKIFEGLEKLINKLS